MTRPQHDEADLEAIRASDPDPLGLMDVTELIAPEARVTGWHRLPGGGGTAMHRVDVAMPSGSQTAFVLRRYLPEDGQDAAVATREAATLEALRDTLVAAPEVLWLDAEGAVFDRPALAMTRVAGRPRSAEVGADPGILRGLAEALVGLQWVAVDTLGHLPAHPDAAALTDELRRSEPPRSDLVDTHAIRRAVLDHADRVAPEPASLGHGDFHVGNVLFDGARPTGIVDWTHARVADPRADVAYCAFDLALLAGMAVAERFLAEHAALRGEMAAGAWWRLRAATSAFPDPLSWIPAWHSLGVRVTDAEVAERFVAWVEAARADLAG